MGATQSNEKYGKEKRGSRGSVNNRSRLHNFASGRTEGSANWNTCHSELLQTVICKITALGGAVTFGLSRDRGAHSLTLLLDDSRVTMWYNGKEDLDDKLGEVIIQLDDMD